MHNNVNPKLNAYVQKLGGEGAFKAPPHESYRVNEQT